MGRMCEMWNKLRSYVLYSWSIKKLVNSPADAVGRKKKKAKSFKHWYGEQEYTDMCFWAFSPN
jgi:hypothetical protein